ncbi:unnamed protein product [Ilex paraguariensis]|uniref:Uncharacterized protein n=1 Tax=Ilex paraguariensis TaxID=185542 RepID=A0ABC8THZ4_9AQUA
MVLPTNLHVVASNVKKISWDKMQRRHEKGLCFYCDERFTLGHKCWTSHLLLIKNIHEEGKGFLEEDHLWTKDDMQTDVISEISLHALSRWNALRAMRIVGHIFKKPVLVIIDSGSTHNFINDKVIE